jgi:hypothetical protein
MVHGDGWFYSRGAWSALTVMLPMLGCVHWFSVEKAELPEVESSIPYSSSAHSLALAA